MRLRAGGSIPGEPAPVPGGSPGVAGETRGVAGALLRGGLVAAAIGTTAVIVAAIPAGLPAVTGAAVGGLIAAAAMAVGPLLLRLGRDLDPVVMFGLAVLGYGVVVIVLGVAFQALAPLTWMSAEFVGVAVLASAGAWIAGQFRATRRLRILSFGGGEKRDTQAGHLPKHR